MSNRLRQSSPRSIAAVACWVGLLLLLGPNAQAQRVFEEGGNDYFGVSIADVGNPATDTVAGFFTAWTRAAHPVSDSIGMVGFLLDHDLVGWLPHLGSAGAFSHASIRSYGSATDYPLGRNPNFIFEPESGFDCRPTTEWGYPLVEQVLEAGQPIGVRAAWSIVNGVDDLGVELTLRARGEDLMRAAVQLDLRIINHAADPARVGARNMLQLSRSQPPATARFLTHVALRDETEPTEPLDRIEDEWLAPSARAWEGWYTAETPYSDPGSGLYAVAGTLRGPESLVPAPTPPDLLQWAEMNTFGHPLFPGLVDRCFHWSLPLPGRIIANRAALAFTWGHDEAHAIELGPGDEVTFTQYLMAFIEYPLEVEIAGPWELECAGPVSEVAVSAEALPLYETTAEIQHEWSSPDPRVSFADPRAAETTAFVEGVGSFPIHHRSWIGPWEAHADDEIRIVDTEAPRLEELSASPSSLWPPNHRLVDVELDWEASDTCDAAPQVRLISASSNEPERRLPGWGAGATESDVVGAELDGPDRALQLRAERAGVGGGRVYTLTYEVADGSGNVAFASVEVPVAHDRGRRR